MMAVPLNQAVTLVFRVYSDSPADTMLADPTSVTLTLLNPDGTTTTAVWPGGAVVRDSLGTFHYSLTPASAGHYEEHWTATGTVPDQAQDGSFDVDALFANRVVSVDDFALYLENAGLDRARAQFILDKAQTLCETVVKPLPAGADIVILDVAERAFANPTNVRGSDLGLYSEGVGPYSTTTPGTVGGGLYLTAGNARTLRRLAGQSGGAFTIDTTPANAGQNLPWWDTGTPVAADWDTPP